MHIEEWIKIFQKMEIDHAGGTKWDGSIASLLFVEEEGNLPIDGSSMIEIYLENGKTYSITPLSNNYVMLDRTMYYPVESQGIMQQLHELYVKEVEFYSTVY